MLNEIFISGNSFNKIELNFEIVKKENFKGEVLPIRSYNDIKKIVGEKNVKKLYEDLYGSDGTVHFESIENMNNGMAKPVEDEMGIEEILKPIEWTYAYNTVLVSKIGYFNDLVMHFNNSGPIKFIEFCELLKEKEYIDVMFFRKSSPKQILKVFLIWSLKHIIKASIVLVISIFIFGCLVHLAKAFKMNESFLVETIIEIILLIPNLFMLSLWGSELNTLVNFMRNKVIEEY